MEAGNVSGTKNVGYLLNQLLPEYYTYNIGISGHTIYAITYYNPSEWIVIETDRVMLDMDMMQLVSDDKLSKIEFYNSGVMYYLQKYVPATKYIYIQVSEWINIGKENTDEIVTDEIVWDDYEKK